MRCFATTNRRLRRLVLRGAVGLGVSSVGAAAQAGPEQGDWLQTDSLSMLLASHDFTTRTNSSIRKVVNLSATVGLHHYVVDNVRLGVGLQLTQRLWPALPEGSSSLQRLAIMPQVGWNFYDPFYTALIFSYAPRTQGRAIADMALLPVLGVSVPVTKRMKFTFALETPFAFLYHRTVGLVALAGVSFRF